MTNSERGIREVGLTSLDFHSIRTSYERITLSVFRGYRALDSAAINLFPDPSARLLRFKGGKVRRIARVGSQQGDYPSSFDQEVSLILTSSVA